MTLPVQLSMLSTAGRVFQVEWSGRSFHSLLAHSTCRSMTSVALSLARCCDVGGGHLSPRPWGTWAAFLAWLTKHGWDAAEYANGSSWHRRVYFGLLARVSLIKGRSQETIHLAKLEILVFIWATRQASGSVLTFIIMSLDRHLTFVLFRLKNLENFPPPRYST